MGYQLENRGSIIGSDCATISRPVLMDLSSRQSEVAAMGIKVPEIETGPFPSSTVNIKA